MIFPIGTDRRLTHTPWVNTTLIVANLLISVWVWSQYGSPRADTPIGPYMLLPWEPRVMQFFTYQFLHADWEHLLLNMLFLWVFGQSLEDRLGPLGYLAFFLAGGVMAGVGYAAFRDHPVLGASGAIAAVTGAYLALFPLSRVTIAFLFLYFFDVSSMFVIGLQIATDLFFQLSGTGGRGVPGAPVGLCIRFPRGHGAVVGAHPAA
jgi:membrane associated rhomboid family serine protease